MGTLFRSEPMCKAQFYLPPEAAYNCVAELGELGSVQFVDLNPEAVSFQRQFVSEVMRCEETERRLRYIESQLVREGMEVPVGDKATPAPQPREMTELEATVSTMESSLKTVSENFVSLRRNLLELKQIKEMLSRADGFLTEHRHHLEEEEVEAAASKAEREETSGMEIHVTAGVIDRSRTLGFETMLWRVSHGNVFVKFADIEETIEDPRTGDMLYKAVFIIFYQGDLLKAKVKKICEGFHAAVYPCPDKVEERKEMMAGIKTRLEDLSTVMSQTRDQRDRLLHAAAQDLRLGYIRARKMKSVYHILNQFSLREGQRVLVGEGWLPTAEMQAIREAMGRGAESSGSAIQPTLEKVSTAEEHPTFHRTNKYTSGYQHLVDAYGVNSYREVNPSVYTIATFPFLFAVMFGDAGHGGWGTRVVVHVVVVVVC